MITRADIRSSLAQLLAALPLELRQEVPPEALRAGLLSQAAQLLWPATQLPPPALLQHPAPWASPALLASCQPILQNWLLGSADFWEQLARLALLAEALASQLLRRQQGLYYTPQPLARFLAQQSLAAVWQGPEQVFAYLDPACGSGVFLWAVFQTLWEQSLARLSDNSEREHMTAEWISAAHGSDLDPLALEVAAFGFACFWARHFPAQTMPSPQLACLDALAGTAAGTEQELALQARFPQLSSQLRLLLSNPPYVGEKHHKELFQSLQQGPWAQDYRGRSDLYYYFFYLALKLGQPETVVGLLTPSYFTTATAARHLRQRLQHQSSLLSLIDFAALRLFPDAGGQQNTFTLFRCQAHQDQKAQQVKLLRSPNRGALRDQHLQDLACQEPVCRPQHELFQGPQSLLVWTAHRELDAILDQMQSGSCALSEWFQVHQGLVSGADRLSAAMQRRYGIAAAVGSGIFVLNHTEAQALDPELLRVWGRPWFKSSDIQAFQVPHSSHYQLLYTARALQQPPTPALLAHLQPFRQLLVQRREVRLGRLAWWQLQWPRQLELFTSPALVLPQRAAVMRAAKTTSPWYASADVYYIQPRTPQQPWSLDALLLLLNSPLYSLWFYTRGKRKGAMLELYQTPLSSLPLPSLSPQQLARWQHLSQSWQADAAGPCLESLHQQVCQAFGLSAEQAERSLALFWQQAGAEKLFDTPLRKRRGFSGYAQSNDSR